MPSNEPIAIVGLGCRFPGGANDPHAFWELLREGVDAITEVPEGRWNAARFYHADPAAPGRMVTRSGGFVANAEAFDAGFFGITPREAARLDPQQRWMLEVAWEAIEDAGLPVEYLAGTRTGVFVGISHSDYPTLHRNDIRAIDGYSVTGSALSIAANRISYLFNLRGPSMAVDTACSSALVALHLAVGSLRSEECDFALVGGVNALLNPGSSVGFSQAHMLSPRARCRAFDAGADGYVRAEGAGAALVMPLRTAQKLGLRIRAQVVATASNQDGHSSGMTVPSGEAQRAMIREALHDADASPGDVVYVEAHGTGTPVGDPIEMGAIAAELVGSRPPGDRLFVGSVKTNIGHLESGSGLAGLIKAVLIHEHRTIPPNLHFEQPNPLLPMDGVSIPTKLTPLPNGANRIPLVAVNSFGFGGTNAHALLAPAPAATPIPASAEDGACIFPLSARSAAALADYAEAFAQLIDSEAGRSLSLRDLCAAAALGKSHHPVRAAFVAETVENLRTQLAAVRKSEEHAHPASKPGIAFVFSGQGPQWWAMGRELYHCEEVFREVWVECDTICRELGGPDLLKALLASEADSPLGHTDITQPALFAVQAGLVSLWRDWGIEPDFVIGHSIGEAAAAWAAGIYDLRQIFRVIIARSRWQEKMHGLGRMLSAAIPVEEAHRWVAKCEGRISLAAVNAPRQVTLSGDARALADIAAALEKAQVFCRFLQTDYAFHSAQMDPIETGLRHDLSDVVATVSRVPMISTVTGARVDGPEMTADYWWRNVRESVRFSAGIEVLLREGCNVFVEIGPHPVLAPAVAEIALTQKSAAASVPSLRRGDDERTSMLLGLAALYQNGAQVRWDELYQRPNQPVRLPTYPWQRHHLWHESSETARVLRSPPSHPLLGDRQPHPLPTWLSCFDIRLTPWLADHRLGGAVVAPAAAYLEMAAAAVREVLGEATIFLEDVEFYHLLFLPADQTVPIWLQLDPVATSFQIFAASPDAPSKWELQADGRYRAGRRHTPAAIDLAALGDGFGEAVDTQALYREMRLVNGQVYGPAFQGLTSLWLQKKNLLAIVEPPAERGYSDYLIYPPALDSCFHSSVALRQHRDRCPVVIVSVRQLRIFHPLAEKLWNHLRTVRRWENTSLGDLTLYDSTGQVLVQIEGLTLKSIDSEARQAPRERKFYGFEWELSPIRAAEVHADDEGAVLIFADRHGLGMALAESLRGRHIQATLVFDQARSRARNAQTLSVNLRKEDWAEHLWKTLAERGPLPRRVLYLWSWGDDALANDSSGQNGCAAFLALAQARLRMEGSDVPARWLVATRLAQAALDGEKIAPALATLWGFVRTVQTEQPQWHISLVDGADETVGEPLLAELFATEIEPEVSLRGAERQVRRLRHFQPKPAPESPRPPAYSLHIGQPGRVDSLLFRGAAQQAPRAGEVEIEVRAAGLNFRDLMKALAIYPLQEGEAPTLGDEWSGRIARVGKGVRKLKIGDRVMGFSLGGGAFSSHLIVPAEAAWKLPSAIGFAEGASVPVIFGTAYHALHNLARIRQGETVLIHAAAGGVGLAAVQLAHQIGAVVLATAGSEEKRDYLRSLGIACVMDSRTLDFADEVMRHTGGRGVDVVLNSLAGAFQQKSLLVCAPQGRFVEIGKRDLFENHSLPLGAFQRSLAFFAFDLGSVLAAGGPEPIAIRRFLSRGFSDGEFQPVPCTKFAARDAVSAFRVMQGAQHIGKIVLEFDEKSAPEVAAEFWPAADGTYLITGGLSGFGLATAQWLAGRGARHLALLSRRGQVSKQDAPILEEIKSQGISVVSTSADVANPKALAAALRRLKKTSPPLRGIFHAAMVLRDHPISEMSQEDLAAVLAPKVAGAWNLHLQTRGLPLDCFVLYSSISSMVGAPGHANYAAANAFLDTLAQARRAEGLPGLSINWGQLADVGIAAEHPEIGRYLESIGVRALNSKDAFAALGRVLVSSEAQVGVMDVDWDKMSRASAKYAASPVFRDLVQAGKSTQSAGQGTADWRESVLALPAEDQIAAVSDLVIAQLAATLGMSPTDIDRAGPLRGMDSLMAVELKVRIEKHAGCELPIDLFNADLTASRLAERLLTRMRTSVSETKHAPEAPRGAIGAEEIIAPLLRREPAPLADLVRAGKLEPLTAAALMSWPDALFEQTQISPAAFFRRLNGHSIFFDLIIETPLGSIGIFMLPLTTSQVKPGELTLMPHVLEGIAQATRSGARCVALTGLIPPSTSYGETVRAACAGRSDLAAITTGHATTQAAVILNLEALLRAAGRHLADEIVLSYGIGSIGMGALRLMLDVLPHPAELWLCDPYRSTGFFSELETTLRRKHGFEGLIRVVPPEECYEASVIIGATNAENVLDVARLAPGTLIVDDSAPHCLNGQAALARVMSEKDILCTEGGFVRSGAPMPRIAHVPESLPGLTTVIPQLLLSFLTPHDITGCILSAVLSARNPELAPTIGLVPPTVVRQHWAALAELGFSAAALNYEGTTLSADVAARFRERFRREKNSPPLVATASS